MQQACYSARDCCVCGVHCICARCGELIGFCDCPPLEEEPSRARNWAHPVRNADRALKDLLKDLWYERIGGAAPPSKTSTEPRLPITQIANECRRHAFERGLADWTPFDEWCPWHFEYTRVACGRHPVRVTDGAGAVIYVATPPSPPSATPVPTPFKPTASDGGVADSPLRFRTLSDSRDQPTSTQVDGTQCTPCAPEDFKPAILRLCGTNGAYTTQELDCSILPDRHG